MNRKQKRDDYWVCFERETWTTKQKKTFDSISNSHGKGTITTREAYHAFKYYAIPTMLASDLPY